MFHLLSLPCTFFIQNNYLSYKEAKRTWEVHQLCVFNDWLPGARFPPTSQRGPSGCRSTSAAPPLMSRRCDRHPKEEAGEGVIRSRVVDFRDSALTPRRCLKCLDERGGFFFLVSQARRTSAVTSQLFFLLKVLRSHRSKRALLHILMF